MPQPKRTPDPDDIFPIEFLNAGSMFYTIDGQAHTLDEILTKKVHPDKVMLVINNAEESREELAPEVKRAKAFSRNFFAKELYHQLQTGLGEEADESPAGAELTDEALKDDFQKLMKSLAHSKDRPFKDPYPEYSALEEKFKAHYYDHNGARPEERWQMVAEVLDAWLEPITADKAFEDHINLHDAQEEISKAWIDGILEETQADKKTPRMMQEFMRMPEWVQILAHDRGLRITLNTLDDIGATDPMSHLISIRIDTAGPSYALSEPTAGKSLLYLLMFEELTHGLHTNRNSGEFDSLAIDLQRRMRADPAASEALKLIEKWKPGGGSFFHGSVKSASSELLVDILQAEIYFCRQEKKTQAEAETEMRRVFGDRIYDLSRQFLTSWINEAATLLEQKLGPDEAARYKEKWLEDPLLHNISLTRLPEYNLTARAAQRGAH